MSQKVALLPLIIGCLLFAGGIIALSQDEVSEDAISPSNAYCLLCHEQTDDMFTFASGETISLHVDQTILANSVHGNENQMARYNVQIAIPIICFHTARLQAQQSVIFNLSDMQLVEIVMKINTQRRKIAFTGNHYV